MSLYDFLGNSDHNPSAGSKYKIPVFSSTFAFPFSFNVYSPPLYTSAVLEFFPFHRMSTYDHSRVQQFIGTRLSSFHCEFVNDRDFSGGNSLDKASASSVHDFVKANGGHTVITKVCLSFFLCSI